MRKLLFWLAGAIGASIIGYIISNLGRGFGESLAYVLKYRFSPDFKRAEDSFTAKNLKVAQMTKEEQAGYEIDKILKKYNIKTKTYYRDMIIVVGIVLILILGGVYLW